MVGITTGILEGGQRLNMALPVDLVYTLASRATSVDKAQALQGPKKAKDLVDVEWHDAIDQAKAAIKTRKSEWDNCKASRSVVEANIGLLSQQMNSLKSANRISEYNQLVPQYNQQVSHLQSVQRTCDQLYQIYTQQVDAHNSIVGRYNSR